MLTAHMASIEKSLVAQSGISANSGHSLHKGTPRESFIREFLQAHLPAIASIGTGEIIDAQSLPGQSRNQFDIVLYKNNYPKLDFGGGMNAFLIESVVATIEVKSKLTKADLEQAIRASQNAKNLTPSVTKSFHSGYVPPRVLNYVVAYDGPQKMATVTKWISEIHRQLEVPPAELPSTHEQRLATPAPTIDGVFILNKGFAYFDNVHLGLESGAVRDAVNNLVWCSSDVKTGGLLFLFLLLQSAFSNVQGQWLNPLPYVKEFSVPNISWSSG